MTRSVLAAALCVLAALSCGDSGTGPSEPAEPTGKLLVFDPTGAVHVVALATGEMREVSRDGEPFSSVSPFFNEDAKVVIGGGNGLLKPAPGVRQLDLNTGTVTTLVDTFQASTTRLAPDGKTLIFGGARWWTTRFALWTTQVGSAAEPVRRWIAPDSALDQSIGNLHWLPDQSGLIGNLYESPVVQLVHFDLATGVVTPITEPSTILEMTRTLALSPDGRTIAFNTHTGELRFITLSGEPAPGCPADLRGLRPVFSPDGRLLVWTKLRDGILESDGVWFYRFSDGAMCRALPEESEILGALDWG